ncbi:serine/threonine-protein phosphatase 2A activator [Ramicandelaber brevisporus]|nr:serine/threonine-protein phosphatase 2A activator [Ramicandelaber brevisporus]
MATAAAPRRRVLTADDMAQWGRSAGRMELVAFLEALNLAVQSKAVEDVPATDTARHLTALLDTVDGWIDDIPTTAVSGRFGSPAFRDWQARLQERTSGLEEAAVLPNIDDAVWVELETYFAGSFGNSTRIDYGTGHEMSFAIFLLCLAKIGAYGQDEFASIVLHVFARYLNVARKLQRTYRLEPAGSHGVWGLDDYQFLPFYFGSSQMIGRADDLKPSVILSKDMAVQMAESNLFMAGIAHIHVTKTGPFFEHSPVLNDIAHIPTWTKINSGLLKMFKGEVLDKFPIIQHVPFGTLFPF